MANMVESRIALTLQLDKDIFEFDGLSDFDHCIGRVLDHLKDVLLERKIPVVKMEYTRGSAPQIIEYIQWDDDDDPEDAGPSEFE